MGKRTPIVEVTGSIQLECERRLSTLYTESHSWLLKSAKKITKNTEEAEDLCMELYEYLHNKCNPKLFWGDSSYNIMYCKKFLAHRFYNKTKKLNRITYVGIFHTEELEIPYDVDKDEKLEKAHREVIEELKKLQMTKMWPSAKIFELYWMSEDTLDEVAKKIGISKSTTFLAVKKIRKYLESVIENPFEEN
jgi:DNA-directed RNA polymerase specialized sigma24 family protein